MTSAEILDVVARLLLAGGLGALLGMEREIRGHAAGTRTQSLVAVGAALFTIVGSGFFEGTGVDTSRVAAQVVSGIGFLGAGVILRNGVNIRGLTTAATLWVSAGLGVAAGAGALALAAIAGGIALFFVYGLRLVKPLTRGGSWHTVHVEYQQGHGTLGPIIRELEDMEGIIGSVHVDDEEDEVAGAQVRKVDIRVNTREDDRLERLLRLLERRPEVHHTSVEGG